MHMPFLVGIVLHTTLLAIVGYALLFSANKTEGFVALLGRVLGIWVFILAIAMAVGAVLMPHDRPFGPMGVHGGPGMHPWGPPPDGIPPPPPPAGAIPPAPPKP